MVNATFRFHERLNDFLPRGQRGREIATPCARGATTKHMIEALGVPHTEVGQVMVNGEPSGFGRLLAEGDSVAAYPARGLPEAQALRAWPAGRLRFVADAHLGGLARLLRMAGYDTLYDTGYPDDEIERIAREQQRVLLTRDRELLKRRTVELGCYLHALDPAEQLRELFGRFELGRASHAFTLCLHCNLPLRPVAKADVLDRLPPRVADTHHEFTTCDACGRVYWKGSHYERMRGLLAGVAAAAADVELPRTPDSAS